MTMVAPTHSSSRLGGSRRLYSESLMSVGACDGLTGSLVISEKSLSGASTDFYAQVRPKGSPERFSSVLADLKRMNSLKDGWNGYSAPRPSTLAIQSAESFVFAVSEQGLKPFRVAPSAVGGVGVTFKNDGAKAYIEFYNDGSACALLSRGLKETSVFPIRLENRQGIFDDTIAEIRDWLNE